MKLLILSALVSLTAVAGEVSRSELLEIDGSYDYDVTSVVALDGVNVSILNACVDGDSVKAIAPITVCTAYVWVDNGENGSLTERRDKVCVETAQVSPSQALSYEASYCKRFKTAGYDGRSDAFHNLPESCAKWGTKTYSTQTSFYPTIRKLKGQKDTYSLGKKFSLPACN